MAVNQNGEVGKVAPAPCEEALRHFQARRSFETDPSEVYEDLKAEVEGLIVADVRSKGAFDKAHVPGAISLPFDEITEKTIADLGEGIIVTYCWGPGCNGSTQAAVALSALGRRVKEMIGGWEYWLREDFPTEGKGRVQNSYLGER